MQHGPSGSPLGKKSSECSGGAFLEVDLGVCVAVEDDAFLAAVVGGVFAVVCSEVCVILAEERLAVDDGNLEKGSRFLPACVFASLLVSRVLDRGYGRRPFTGNLVSR